MSDVPPSTAPTAATGATPTARVPAANGAGGAQPRMNPPEDLSFGELLCLALYAAVLSFFVLVFGGLALRAYSVLRFKDPQDLLADDWLRSLLVFGVCGGVTIGTLLFTWRLTHRKRRTPRWGIATLLLAVVLFGLLVWPTPWRYQEYGCKVFQINRFIGSQTVVTTLPSCEGKDTAAYPDKR